MGLNTVFNWSLRTRLIACLVLCAANSEGRTLADDAASDAGSGKVKPKQVVNAQVQYLIQQLTSRTESERLDAVTRLGELGATARPAVSQLRALASDESDRVYLGAEIALKQILKPAVAPNDAKSESEDTKVTRVDPEWLRNEPAPKEADNKAAESEGLMSPLAITINLVAFIVVVGATLMARKYWGPTNQELAELQEEPTTSQTSATVSDATGRASADSRGPRVESDWQPASVPFNANVRSATDSADTPLDQHESQPAEELDGPIERKWGIFAPPDDETRETLTELTALLGNPTPEVRLAAVGDLAQLGLAAVPVLIELLDDKDAQIRRIVMATLSGIGLAAAPQLLESGEAFRDTREVGEGDLSDVALSQYVRQLEASDPEFRCRAATGLAAGGSRAVPHLIAALRDPDPEVRRRSTASLGRIGDSSLQTIHALETLLSDTNDEVRAGAASALGNYGMRGIPSLFKALDDSEPEVRKRATHCLNSIGMSAIPMIIQHLGAAAVETKEANAKVTQRADVFTKRQQISSLAAGGISALPDLINELNERDDETRRRAIAALGRIGEAASVAIPNLQTMLLDRNPEIRRAVVSALGWMDSAAVPLLSDALTDHDMEVKLRALASLGRFQAEAAPAVNAIAELLNDPSPRLQEEAVRTLGNLSLVAMSCLDKVHRLTQDENAHVRAAAIHAINRIGPTRRAA